MLRCLLPRCRKVSEVGALAAARCSALLWCCGHDLVQVGALIGELGGITCAEAHSTVLVGSWTTGCRLTDKSQVPKEDWLM
jgi:hypothetical protein